MTIFPILSRTTLVSILLQAYNAVNHAKLVTPDEGQMLLDIPGESIDLAQKWAMDELAF